MAMRRILWRLRRGERGATALEYALLAASLGLAAILGAQLLEGPMTNRYNATCGEMSNPAAVAGDNSACLAEGVAYVPDPSPPPQASPPAPPPSEEPSELPPTNGGCPAGYKLNGNGTKCVKDNKPN